MKDENSILVASVLETLASLGVQEICIAAGARNIALVRGVLASRNMKVWNFFEERSMAFYALGRSMVTRGPVAVITTSGTAAVELMPAVVEAYYQGLPLIAVTADRPQRYRGSGAPQAIEQVDLYGKYAPCFDLEIAHDLTRVPSAIRGGPIQLNVCLEEGIGAVPVGVDFGKAVTVLTGIGDFHDIGEIDLVLVAGLNPAEAAAVSPVLANIGAPVLAEGTANLRDVDHLLLKGGERALKSMFISRVLRIGSVPSWRWWRDLEDRPDIEVLHYSRVPFPGLARDVGHVVHPLEDLDGITATSSSQARREPADVLALHPLSEPAWMRHLRAAIPSGSRLFLGNSLPIREWNLACGNSATIDTYASRGTNGIDGIISTYLGVSADCPESWLIIGDLSALYDLSAPWILSQLPAGNRRIVIINNGGGKIFSRVDSLRALEPDARDLIENSHALGFEAWAAMWGIPYRRVTEVAQVQNLPEGAIVLEVVPDAAETEAFWAAWRAA